LKPQKNILGKFKYVKNEAILHTDESLMPQKKRAWSSWNSISDGKRTCITYWLNKLQNLKTPKNYFLTLNPIHNVQDNLIIKKINFTHPYLNNKSFEMQNRLKDLQGIKRVWFSGSYFGYGFHEDGLKSSLEMLKKFEGYNGDVYIQRYSNASKI